MPIATNPSDGAVVFLGQDGQWQPAQTAVNPQTKEMLAFDGRDWVPVPASGGVFERISQTVSDALTPAKTGEEMGALDVAKSAVRNAPASAAKFAQDLVHPILHPIDTAEAIKNIGHGLLQKVGFLSGDDKEKYADAVGKFFYDRYGSSEGIKKAIAEDPVGVLADVSLILTGGGSLTARAPGVAGKVGEAVAAAGRTVDPVNAAVGATRAVGAKVADGVGVLTGTGGDPLRAAARAGEDGGAASQAFRDQLRGTGAMEEVVTEAKAAVDALRRERGQSYRDAMQKVGADQTVLDFAKIDQAVQASQNVKKFKGQDLSPSTVAVRDDITKTINDWKALDPKDFHTAEGLDALKQKIGDIADATKHGSPERVVADNAYRAIRQTIIDQVPEYAKVMKGYEQASTIIKEIERTLSVNPKASVDTALRKLQSVMRNNVNTNYGKRGELAELLVSAGATHLITKLAGQALNAWTPRGLSKLLAGGASLGVAGPMVSGIGLPVAPVAASVLPFTSPRLMGEAAHLAGRGARNALSIGRASYQLGRETQQRPR